MRSSCLIFITGFCLVFAAACGDDDGGGTGGVAGGTGGAGGGTGGAGGGGTGGAPGGALTGDFRAYNSLLPVDTACETPDLSSVPGANLTGIADKCILETMTGSLTVTDTGGGNVAVTGTYDLMFTINATIMLGAQTATVDIETMSQTALTGTGVGSATDGGSITLDMLAAPKAAFNLDAAATGNVNCAAEAAGTDLSSVICPMAGLVAGDNTLPLPGDPNGRTFPVLNFSEDGGELIVVMGDGATNANGWFLVNPAPLSGNGTQFGTLTGPVTVEGTGGTGGSGGAP